MEEKRGVLVRDSWPTMSPNPSGIYDAQGVARWLRDGQLQAWVEVHAPDAVEFEAALGVEFYKAPVAFRYSVKRDGLMGTGSPIPDPKLAVKNPQVSDAE